MDVTYKTTKYASEKKEEADGLRTLGLEAWHRREFSCCLLPRLESQEAGCPNINKCRPKIAWTKASLSSQRTRKTAAKQDRKVLDNNYSTPSNTIGNILVPPDWNQPGPVGRQDFHLYYAIHGGSPSPSEEGLGPCPGRLSREPELPRLPGALKHPSTSLGWCQRRSSGVDFHKHPL